MEQMPNQVDREAPGQTGEPQQPLDERGLSASSEDYLEAILQVERASRVARVSEIADLLKVSRPSVTGALKTLAARGLVVHARYGHVTLTEAGERVARDVERRHLAIRDFLTAVLELPLDKAEVTACRMEHVLDADVLERFIAYAQEQSRLKRGKGK